MSFLFPCLLQGSIQHATGARAKERHWKIVIAFSLFAAGRKNRRCLFPACYREGASVQLEPVDSFSVFATGQHPACYWCTGVGRMLLDFHCRSTLLSCALFRTISTGQVKYTRRLPKDVSGSWEGCPSNVKKLRGQRKRAQQKRQHGQAHKSTPG